MDEKELNMLNNWFDYQDELLTSEIKNATILNDAGKVVMLTAKFNMLQNVRETISKITKE